MENVLLQSTIITTSQIIFPLTCMPSLCIPALLDHLDNILDELSALWSCVQNYEHLAHIEAIAEKIEKIVKTLKSLEK